MSNTKLLASVLLVLAVLFVQVGSAAAAAPTQTTTPITGTVQSISTETDANGVVTTAVVTLLLPDQTTQTVRIPAAYATDLGLLDPITLQPVPPENVPAEVSIDPAQVLPEEEPTEESVHPIAWLLAEFFGEDPAVIEGYHEDGFGFGVIAQSLWISKNVSGDASLADQILQAKQSGDYSNIMLSDGTALTLPDGTVPTNWGQFKKALSEKKNNLGVIVSGHADPENSNDSLQTQQHGNGKDKDNKGKGRDKNKNHP